MNTATIITLIALGIMLIDACPIVTSVNGSCCEVKSNKFKFFITSLKSRVYNITNFCGDCELTAEGYCDAVTNGGGWVVVQRRQDGSVDFNRGWIEYEKGFGSLTGEFWYGLHPLHCLTNQGQWQLRVDFTFTNGTKSYLSYTKFSVGPANSQYQLSISGFTGITTDPFTGQTQNGMKFTTKDRDNDKWDGGNCAIGRHGGNAGGSWYNICSHILINHQYKHKDSMYLNGKWYSLPPFIEMKIKPITCNV